MSISKIWNWIKLNYLSGAIVVCYEYYPIMWQTIMETFTDLAIQFSDNPSYYIAVTDELIEIERKSSSGLKYPAETLTTNAIIRPYKSSIHIDINIDLGEYFYYFIIIWKGAVLSFTLVFVASLIGILGRCDITTISVGTLILLVFNGICWLQTYLMKLEARKMFNFILKMIQPR